MAMERLAALVYDVNTFESTIPQRPWEHGMTLEGGSLEVASGAMESFTVLEKRELDVVVRCRESELQMLMQAVSYGVRNPGLLTYYPNGVDMTGYPVYVISPKHGERWSPGRGQMDSFEAKLTLRRVDGQPWDISYYT